MAVPGWCSHPGAPAAEYAGYLGHGYPGIESPPAFVRAPEGNGCAKRFIRTLKENLLWVRHFETIKDLRQALLTFCEIYNTAWLIERHKFVSPAAFRQNQLEPIARRHRVQPGFPETAGGTEATFSKCPIGPS
jgi:Integrase core domain